MMIKFEKNQSNPGILFTGITLNHEGMHHAREPVSFLMCINILMKILIEYTKGDKTMIELVKSRNIYFIPIINVDGFILNTKIYQNTSNFGMARKNGRKDVIFSQCNGQQSINKSVDRGVDLNRNYDFHYAENDLGSSNYACADDYRGLSAFSEPETYAIKIFLDEHNIKIAFNYHSFGNFIVIPFNFDNEENMILKNNFTLFYNLYQEFYFEANFPFLDFIGNDKKGLG